MFAGKKTYVVAAAMVVYELLGYLLNGTAPNINTILNGLGLAALRAGIAKG